MISVIRTNFICSGCDWSYWLWSSVISHHGGGCGGCGCCDSVVCVGLSGRVWDAGVAVPGTALPRTGAAHAGATLSWVCATLTFNCGDFCCWLISWCCWWSWLFLSSKYWLSFYGRPVGGRLLGSNRNFFSNFLKWWLAFMSVLVFPSEGGVAWIFHGIFQGISQGWSLKGNPEENPVENPGNPNFWWVD